jgi:wyosine [tRNA(Phe)-imidazoG37] synthetase (radical SAM superfamily)
VLTNGSLLWREDVREDLMAADLVMPSLDAGDELLFRAVNRPHPDISFEQMAAGLERFRRDFKGRYWLEVLLLAGHTALPAHARKIAKLVRRIRPDQVHLNTSVRPPAEEIAVRVPHARLTELARLFSPRAEVIAEYRRRGTPVSIHSGQPAILDLLRRRPCTELDVARGLAMKPIEATKLLADLEATRQIVTRRHGEQVFYHLAQAALPEQLPCNLPKPRGSVPLLRDAQAFELDLRKPGKDPKS